MKIRLKNFCKFIDKEICFNCFETILLDGSSGQGKSTILESIRFCLYGSNQNVYFNGIKGDKTSVEIIFDEYSDLRIKREKPPERLEVKLNQLELSAEAAQEYIYTLFGNQEMFLSTSYMMQNHRHPLMQLSNKDKFELLISLTFGLDPQNQPDNYLKKIDLEMNQLEEKYRTTLDKSEKLKKKLESNVEYDPNYQELIHKIKSYNSDIKCLKVFTKEMIQLQLKITQLETELKLLYKDTRTYEDRYKDLIPFYSQLKDVSFEEISQLKHLDPVEPVAVSNLELNLDLDWILKEYSHFQDLTARKTKLTRKLSEIPCKDLIEEAKSYYQAYSQIPFLTYPYIDENDPDLKYEKSIEHFADLDFNFEELSLLQQIPEIEEYLNRSKIYQQFCMSLKMNIDNFRSAKEIKDRISQVNKSLEERKICELNQIIYEPSEVNKRVNYLSVHLPRQDEYKKYQLYTQEIQAYQKELSLIELDSELKIQIQELGITDETSVENHINILKCPKCEECLQFKDNKLSLAGQPISLEEAEKIKDYLRKERKSIQLITNINLLKEELSYLESGPIFNHPKKEEELLKILQGFNFFPIEDITKLKEEYHTKKIIEKYPWIKEFKLIHLPSRTIEKYLRYKTIFGDGLAELIERKEEISQKIRLYQHQKKIVSFHSRAPPHFESLSDLNRCLNKSVKWTTQLAEVEKNLIKYRGKERIFEISLSDLLHHQKYLIYQEYLENERRRNNIKHLDIIEKFSLEKVKIFLQNYPEYQEKLARIEHLNINLTELKTDFTPPSDLEQKIKELNLEIDRLDKVYSYSFKKAKLLSYQKRLSSLEIKKTSLIELRDLTVKARNLSLKNFALNFSQQTNAILNEIFDEEMEIQLQLEKQNKTNEKIRNTVNFLINYKGIIFENPQFLSGGERDRLSLAMTISSALLAESKIILLDECLSSLNEELRMRCIEVIGKYLPGKTVVNVCHSVIKGYHTSVIEV